MHKPNILQLIKTIAIDLQPCCENKLCAEQEAWWLVEKVTNNSKTDLLIKHNVHITQASKHNLQIGLHSELSTTNHLLTF